MESGNYINGEKNGNWEVFDENGVLVSSAFMQRGEISGHLNIYNNQGELINKIDYDNAEE